MNARGGFPWPLAAAGVGLMLVSMLTVSIRSALVAEGLELQTMVIRRASLRRQARALELQLQALRRDLGAEARRTLRDGSVGP